MAGGILDVDTSFPDLAGAGSDKEKIAQITDYLYMLLENLRYTLGNLGTENFNGNSLDGLKGEIVEKAVDSLTITASDGAGGTKISINKNGVEVSSATITLTGVVKFADLADTTKVTEINGASVTSGEFNGCTFNCLLDDRVQSGEKIDGKINFYYREKGNLGGILQIDDNGSGDGENNPYRIILEAGEILVDNGFQSPAQKFALKLKSAAGMSFESGENIFMRSKNGRSITLVSADDIKLYTGAGKHVYVNDVQIG